MSWTVSCEIKRIEGAANWGKDEIAFRVAETIGQAAITGNEHCLSERDDAFWRASQVAADCVASGAFGDVGQCDFTVILGGHSNPGNVPHHQWANDCLSIQIFQIAPKPKAPEPTDKHPPQPEAPEAEVSEEDMADEMDGDERAAKVCTVCQGARHLQNSITREVRACWKCNEGGAIDESLRPGRWA